MLNQSRMKYIACKHKLIGGGKLNHSYTIRYTNNNALKGGTL